MTDSNIRLADRLIFWIAVSAILLFGFGFTVFGSAISVSIAIAIALVTPIATAGLLSIRTLVLMVRGRSADLHLWKNHWLRGATAKWVPIAILISLLVLREAGAYNAHFYSSRHNHESQWSQSTTSASGPAVVLDGIPTDDPSWNQSPSRFTILDREDVFARTVQEQLQLVGTPNGATLATVTLNGDVPRAWSPLLKQVDCEVTATITLQIKRGEQLLRWSCDYRTTHNLSIRGFLAAREVPVMLAKTVGKSIADIIQDEMPELEKKLAG